MMPGLGECVWHVAASALSGSWLLRPCYAMPCQGRVLLSLSAAAAAGCISSMRWRAQLLVPSGPAAVPEPVADKILHAWVHAL